MYSSYCNFPSKCHACARHIVIMMSLSYPKFFEFSIYVGSSAALINNIQHLNQFLIFSEVFFAVAKMLFVCSKLWNASPLNMIPVMQNSCLSS